MRGKRVLGIETLDLLRIIPAHAGQTSSMGVEPITATDHPRACGVNMEPLSVDWSDYGSSPRMRGKLDAVTARHHAVRIIPAHAGQTTAPCRP